MTITASICQNFCDASAGQGQKEVRQYKLEECSHYAVST